MLILNTDYSDPDVIRVGDTFFLTASSFNFVPGLPILESRDLRNWKLINYALKKIALPGYEKPQHGKGVWAPAIREHDGVFYIFFATPDEGIFEVHTKDIRGEWSEMNCVWSGKGFIDPCPFWDDDGKFYIVHAYAKSRIGFNSKLGILELSAPTEKSCEAQPDDRIIFDGTKTQPTIEGPKVYKRNSFYYILAPAGGVTNGWQTALRSKNIFGPYEEKIIMQQGTTKINGPHQGALFDDAAGNWHFVHFQDKGIFGRVTHLERAGWKNDWPVLGTGVDGAEIGEPEEEISAFVATDGDLQKNLESRETTLGVKITGGDFYGDWQFLGNTDGLSRENQKTFPLWENPFVLTKKITEAEFDYSIEVSAKDTSTGSVSGIIFLGDEYAALCVDFSKNEIFYLESEKVSCEDKNLEVRREKILWIKCVRDSSGRVSETAVKITSCDFHLTSRNATRESESLSRHPWRRRSEAKAVAANSPTSPNGEVTPIKLSLHFTATSDNFANVTFSAKIDGMEWVPDVPPFKTKNAHWVGGRFGKF